MTCPILVVPAVWLSLIVAPSSLAPGVKTVSVYTTNPFLASTRLALPELASNFPNAAASNSPRLVKDGDRWALFHGEGPLGTSLGEKDIE